MDGGFSKTGEKDVCGCPECGRYGVWVCWVAWLSAGRGSVLSAMDESITFLHSSDWQLGVMRRVLRPDGQARWGQSRLGAVARIGEGAERARAALLGGPRGRFEHNHG